MDQELQKRSNNVIGCLVIISFGNCRACFGVCALESVDSGNGGYQNFGLDSSIIFLHRNCIHFLETVRTDA